MAEQAPSQKRKRPLKKRLKRQAMRRVASAAERVDFQKLISRIAHSESGRPWLERYADLPPAWPQEDQLDSLAADLAQEQLAAEGKPAGRAEVEGLVQETNHRYDHELHKIALPAVTTLMNGFFQQADPSRPFTSPDGRDTAHTEELRRHRDQGRGVLYLINHSSHLDEFLVATVLGHQDLGLPLFAAGANMMAIKSLAKVLRASSYIVQRRGASRAALAVLYNYCRAISMTGGQQAIFLEAWHGGARSRDGSLRYPRRLVTLRGALDLEDELVIQPVAISYSIVPEDLSLAARRGGLTWLKGMGLWSTLGRIPLHPRSWVWRSVQDLYGRARVSLPRPLLLSELRERHAADPGGMVLDEYVALTAIREIARSKKVMASQLTARGLVRARRQMVERGDQAAPPDLVEATELERERLAEYHRGAFGQEPDLEDFIREHPTKEVVADGLRALKRRGVVSGWRSLGAGKTVVKSEAGLAFYANHGDRRIYSPTADQNLVVVGAGSWGFALTSLVGNRILEEKRYLNASLTLYDPREEVARKMGVTRRPPGRFEEHRLPKNAFVTADPPSAFKKASEVILASPPDKLAERAAALMRESEQPLKVVVATCGFEPQGHRLPCQVVLDAAEAAGRRDVAVYALVGPVTADDLVLAKPVSGILAGPAGGRSELADLFRWPPAGVEEADDALGTQAAAILARVYALWGNVLARLGETVLSSQLGHYMARATAEAARLARALGGRPETFAAGAPAWTTVFVDSGLHGPVREFGRKLGQTAKRGDGAAAAARKLAQQMDQEGEAPLAYLDLLSAHEASLRLGVAAPILERARRTLWGG